ncbi:hypothetical protein, partial [Candidatus Accumulibacter contiguus]|uniref:hypothetical protein n=1 Tax=Candidatus Accumulibacter contiguus TaxID=2954381 RepID=UPI001B7DEAAF
FGINRTICLPRPLPNPHPHEFVLCHGGSLRGGRELVWEFALSRSRASFKSHSNFTSKPSFCFAGNAISFCSSHC